MFGIVTRSERRSRRASGGGTPELAPPLRARRSVPIQVIGFLGLSLLWVLMGGAAGAYLAQDAAVESPAGPLVSLALPRDEAPDHPDPATVAPHEPPSEVADAMSAGLREDSVADGEAVAPAPSREIELVALRVPDLHTAKPAAWQRHAVSVEGVAGRPMIAVVIDDLGLNRPAAWRAIALPAPLTLAFMTYAEGLPAMTARARAAGHELLVHVPMQPRSPTLDPGPNVLSTKAGEQEATRRLAWGLGRFAGFVGINNHMGSRFTSSAQGMAMVMRELKARGLLFLDSVTSGSSVGPALARRVGVPYARRDVFLDNDPDDRAAIRRQLDALERLALRRGYAVAIGHPHRATLDVLAEWIPEARRRGFALVPISAVVRHRVELAHQMRGSAG